MLDFRQLVLASTALLLLAAPSAFAVDLGTVPVGGRSTKAGAVAGPKTTGTAREAASLAATLPNSRTRTKASFARLFGPSRRCHFAAKLTHVATQRRSTTPVTSSIVVYWRKGVERLALMGNPCGIPTCRHRSRPAPAE